MGPKKCPVCGKNSIKPILRSTVTLEGEPRPVSGVLAYRCGQGHVFMVAPKGSRSRKK